VNLFGRPLNTSPIDPRLLEEANRALFARAQLDNAPVGSVGAPGGVRASDAAVDRRVNPLQAAALASAPIPGVGDVFGIAADAQMFANEPDSRTPLNFGLSALGLLPLVPPAVASAGALGYLMNRGGQMSDFSRMFPSQAGIVGGRRAATADLGALAKAEDMASSGASREAIFADTGWWKGGDGQWRFEIDDSAARVVDAENPGRLADRFSHPAAFSAYPDAAGTVYSPRLNDTGTSEGAYAVLRENIDLGEKYGGQFLSGEGRITASAPNAEELRSVTLHEMQHRTQDAEGFATGGTPKMAVNIDVGDAVASMRKKLSALELKYSGIYSGGSQSAESSDLYREIAELEDDIDAMESGDAFLNYRHLAGEAEARTVQARRNMTAAERKARPFWQDFDVPEAEQIVRRGEGPAASVDDIADTSRALFHGTGGPEFDWFDPQQHAKRNYYSRGVHLAESPDLADVYARQHADAQRIMPVYVRKGVNLAPESVFDDVNTKLWKDIDDGVVAREAYDEELVNRLQNMGYGGVEYQHSDWFSPGDDGRLKRSTGSRKAVSVFSPDDIVSRFAE